MGAPSLERHAASLATLMHADWPQGLSLTPFAALTHLHVFLSGALCHRWRLLPSPACLAARRLHCLRARCSPPVLAVAPCCHSRCCRRCDPAAPGSLPPNLVDLTLTALPAFPREQRHFSASLLSGLGQLQVVRLQGWRTHDLRALPPSAVSFTVLLPELAMGQALSAADNVLLLPPEGRTLGMIGIRLKQGGGGGAAPPGPAVAFFTGGMPAQVLALNPDGGASTLGHTPVRRCAVG